MLQYNPALLGGELKRDFQELKERTSASPARYGEKQQKPKERVFSETKEPDPVPRSSRAPRSPTQEAVLARRRGRPGAPEG